MRHVISTADLAEQRVAVALVLELVRQLHLSGEGRQSLCATPSSLVTCASYTTHAATSAPCHLLLSATAIGAAVAGGTAIGGGTAMGANAAAAESRADDDNDDIDDDDIDEPLATTTTPAMLPVVVIALPLPPPPGSTAVALAALAALALVGPPHVTRTLT